MLLKSSLRLESQTIYKYHKRSVGGAHDKQEDLDFAGGSEPARKADHYEDDAQHNEADSERLRQ